VHLHADVVVADGDGGGAEKMLTAVMRRLCHDRLVVLAVQRGREHAAVVAGVLREDVAVGLLCLGELDADLVADLSARGWVLLHGSGGERAVRAVFASPAAGSPTARPLRC
jgi:hypothetical protein